MENKKVTAESYTLYSEDGHWLGQIVLTSDGMFSSVTDYGNLSFAWRNYGKNTSFKEFLININVDYFASKMYCGISYIAHSRNVEKSCDRFAKIILPPLQELLKKELTELQNCEVKE